jgi:hypothetical protein
MSNTYIWIQLLEKDKIKFSSPLGDWIKEMFPGIERFDFDNYSEQFVVDHVIDQAAVAEKLIVAIDAAENIETGPVTRFMNRLVRMKGTKLIILNGHNALIEKMTGVLDQKDILTNPGFIQSKEAIIHFLENYPRL